MCNSSTRLCSQLQYCCRDTELGSPAQLRTQPSKWLALTSDVRLRIGIGEKIVQVLERFFENTVNHSTEDAGNAPGMRAGTVSCSVKVSEDSSRMSTVSCDAYPSSPPSLPCRARFGPAIQLEMPPEQSVYESTGTLDVSLVKSWILQQRNQVEMAEAVAASSTEKDGPPTTKRPSASY